eukprot:Pgem_evm1s16135
MYSSTDEIQKTSKLNGLLKSLSADSLTKSSQNKTSINGNSVASKVSLKKNVSQPVLSSNEISTTADIIQSTSITAVPSAAALAKSEKHTKKRALSKSRSSGSISNKESFIENEQSFWKRKRSSSRSSLESIGSLSALRRKSLSANGFITNAINSIKDFPKQPAMDSTTPALLDNISADSLSSPATLIANKYSNDSEFFRYEQVDNSAPQDAKIDDYQILQSGNKKTYT